MAKQIIWSKLAHRDRFNILNYWNERNQSEAYSVKLNQLFKNSVDLIGKHPEIGKKTEIQDVRYRVVRDYLLTYRITDQFIEILTIWDTRQDPANFERILRKGNS